jgi:nicotinamidase/pyrazinamidase
MSAEDESGAQDVTEGEATVIAASENANSASQEEGVTGGDDNGNDGEDEGGDDNDDEGGKLHKKKHKHGKHSKHHGKEKKQKMKHVVLFIIDPQCDYLKDGPMPIPNSKQDGIRIADMIMNNIHEITEIYVSLNSRHKTHISNPISWVTEKGDTPEPYTVIQKEDVEKGKFRSRMHLLQDSFVEYVNALDENKKDPLVLWPEHCLVGTEGHAISPEINEALQEWAGKNMATVEYIIKGTNVSTEMYSAISAEIAQPEDPATSLDLVMVERLSMTDRVLICGQSLSHSINHTLRDLTTHWRDDKMDKLYLLKDCTSAFPGFESTAEDFLQDMRQKGVIITSCQEAFVWEDREAMAAPVEAADGEATGGDALDEKVDEAGTEKQEGDEDNVQAGNEEEGTANNTGAADNTDPEENVTKENVEDKADEA